MSMPTDAARGTVEPLWRAAVLFRVVALAFAVGVVATNLADYRRQRLVWVALAVMAAWTAWTGFRYGRPAGRTSWVVGADLALTAALQYFSVFLLSPDQLHSSFPTVTTVWTCGPVIAAAVLAGRPAGLFAGGVLSVVNIVTRGFLDADMGRDAVLLLGLGFLVGQTAATARRSAERLRLALRTEAATAERERLARSIHDGVLQVLARVYRHGAELGGEGAELGRLAGEQELALRALIAATPAEASPDGAVDLGARLQLLATPSVQISVPATPVPLPLFAAVELTAVVAEALANAARHAGPDARAWVLLEDLGAEVALSVRDDGPGIPPGRLAAAEAEGRMGAARSMRGRVHDLGGTIGLESGPGIGTEWEIRLPRAARPARRGWLRSWGE